MMDFALFVAGTAAVLFALMWLWDRMDSRRRINAAKNRMNDLVAVASAEKERQQQVIADLRTELSAARAERRREGQEYMDRAMRYEDRISELVRQTQNLAERVASLRQAGLTEGGDDYHVEEASAPKPYATELQLFYDGLENEAQMAAEHFIETRRTRGIDDEQILRELEEEWVVV